MRLVYLFAIGYTVLALSTIWRASYAAPGIAALHPDIEVFDPFGRSSPDDARAWFQRMRPYCNPVEVETQHARMRPPRGAQGVAYSAACFSLAGKIDHARDLIRSLAGDDRWKAAGIVFNVGHPVADAGNDEAAGPIMELVVEFWPNHYMALYHAGAARYSLGQHEAARPYLESFLDHYEMDDGWTGAAEDMLRRIR